MDTYVYSIEDNAETLYVNLTNKCSNSCVFCIRSTVDEIKGKKLWLESENFTEKDVITQFDNYNTPKEVVFCGFGEPFMKLDLLKKVASHIKEKGAKVRVNTNGIGNYVNKRNIVPEIKGLVDEVSISLNSSNKEQYNAISHPGYENAYEEMLDFSKKCVQEGIQTTLSVVSEHPDYDLDIEKCEEIAQNIGAKFRNRKWLDKGY